MRASIKKILTLNICGGAVFSKVQIAEIAKIAKYNKRQPSKVFYKRKVFLKKMFLKKFMALRPTILLKIRLQRRCFPLNFAKFLRTPLNSCFCVPLAHLNKYS